MDLRSARHSARDDGYVGHRFWHGIPRIQVRLSMPYVEQGNNILKCVQMIEL